jgi:hypothetical protein
MEKQPVHLLILAVFVPKLVAWSRKPKAFVSSSLKCLHHHDLGGISWTEHQPQSRLRVAPNTIECKDVFLVRVARPICKVGSFSDGRGACGVDVLPSCSKRFISSYVHRENDEKGPPLDMPSIPVCVCVCHIGVVSYHKI